VEPAPGDRDVGRGFRAAGYAAATWARARPSRSDLGPLRFGFDDDWTAGARNAPNDEEEGAHDYWEWTYHTGQGQSFSGGGRFRTSMETDLLLEYLAARAADRRDGRDERPWLMVASWGPPHEPFTPPEEYRHVADVPLPANIRSEEALAYARESLPLYYALIEAIDHEFGRLVAGLDALGLADDTLVVYTSDHGNMHGSHDAMGKELPFDEATQVPLLLRWPGRFAPGSVLDMPLGAPDLLPTLAGLSGIEPPAGLDGRDVSGALLGRPGAERQEAVLLQVCHSRVFPWPGWRGVRTPQWLLARTPAQNLCFFDVQQDPLGLDNLLGRGLPQQKQLQGLLAELMASVGDSWA
jgi:arylsulfatase A-like enzyme